MVGLPTEGVMEMRLYLEGNPLTEEEIREGLEKLVGDLGKVRKVLVVHTDYTRVDFTHLVARNLYKLLLGKGLEEFHTLNASGTHRAMKTEEFEKKLGLSREDKGVFFHNHEFFNPDALETVGVLSKEFVSEMTEGDLEEEIPIRINKMIFEPFDAIFFINGTIPHESTGFSGGLKIVIPGIASTEVVDTFHWAAVLMGIPKLIGTVDNPARRIINRASEIIFERVRARSFTLNMVYEEEEEVIPRALYIDEGYEGFLRAYEKACELSSKIHIKYIDKPLKRAVQVIGLEFDEVWTAGKGSYKLQRPGVMAKGGQIIIYAPHIKHFHSNPQMDKWIREIGYHCKDYVKWYLKKHPDFNKNVAAHVINVRGAGTFDPETGREEYEFEVILATSIPEEVCKSVNLGYMDPSRIRKEDFLDEGSLWIEPGGKYLYDLRRSGT